MHDLITNHFDVAALLTAAGALVWRIEKLAGFVRGGLEGVIRPVARKEAKQVVAEHVRRVHNPKKKKKKVA